MSGKHLSILLVLSLLIFSCTNGNDGDPEPPIDPDLGKSYFFLEEGKYREYDVTEIRYIRIDSSVTTNYQIREEVREAFDAVDAEKAHLLYRFSREDENDDWALDSVWSSRVERNRAILTANNVQFIKMAFPSNTVTTWDTNLFNGRPEEIIQLKTFNEPFTVGFNTFLNASEIDISTFEDPIVGNDIRKEVYADSIGLVFRESEIVTYCTRPSLCEPGTQVIESGRYYREELIAHGNVNDEN